jgi:murein DD-endopeptidase MepM/ murein hydrolase activator NlpD
MGSESNIMRIKNLSIWTRRLFFGSLVLSLLTTLGCNIIGLIENPAPLIGPTYWSAATGAPQPTTTIWLGETTPVVVTVTPVGPITVTTTPALPIIGLTTPIPLDEAYYRVGTFYMNSDVYIGDPNSLVFRITGHETQPSPNNEAATYHFITFRVTNYSREAAIVPVSDVAFIRHVEQDGDVLTGRWTPQNEPIIARGLPSYQTQQLTPIPPDGEREIILGFVLPNGNVTELGLITDWNRPIEGGLPIWFYLENDPLGPFVDAYKPPPPTPIVLDDGDTQFGGSGEGDGLWPTTGYVTRGFGCHEMYTGIDGAGFGCPPERPWFHNGVDVANAQGTLVWSPVDGVIAYAGSNPTGADCSDLPGSQPPYEGLGNYQRINGDGSEGANTAHYFGHLSSFLVTSGDVTFGQNVAQMGSTGCSTGSHLHWIVYQNGNLLDPAQWAGSGPNP